MCGVQFVNGADTLSESAECVSVLLGTLWEDRTHPDIKPKDFLLCKDRKSKAAVAAGQKCAVTLRFDWTLP